MTSNETDRIRNASSDETNRQIDLEIKQNVLDYQFKSIPEIHARMEALDLEWDIERVLTLNASVLALLGLTMGVSKDKRWLALPATVLAFLMQHSIQGWCPPLPLFRALGIRTRGEIDREKYALKALINEHAELSDNHVHAESYVP